MDDEFLKKLKKSYLKTEVPTYLKEDGWDDLVRKLDQPIIKKLTPFFYSPYAFAAVLLLLVVGIVSGIVLSKPNTPAYTVKQATEHTLNPVINDSQTKLQTIATPSAQPILRATPTPTPTPTSTPTVTPISTPKTVINAIDHMIQNLIPENQQDSWNNHGNSEKGHKNLHRD